MRPVQFCISIFLGIHRNPKQKEQGTANLAYSKKKKNAKMAFFNPWMKFENFLGQMSSFDVLWKCHWVTFFPKVSQALSKYFSKRINWIMLRIPRWIWKILFVLSSYEFLAMLEVPFFYGSIWWNNSVDFLRLAVSVFIRLYNVHSQWVQGLFEVAIEPCNFDIVFRMILKSIKILLLVTS